MPAAQEIQSLIAVPVYHDGSATGALELYFGKTLAFTAQDVHTFAELMAGLVTWKIFARDSGTDVEEILGGRARQHAGGAGEAETEFDYLVRAGVREGITARAEPLSVRGQRYVRLPFAGSVATN